MPLRRPSSTPFWPSRRSAACSFWTISIGSATSPSSDSWKCWSSDSRRAGPLRSLLEACRPSRWAAWRCKESWPCGRKRHLPSPAMRRSGFVTTFRLKTRRWSGAARPAGRPAFASRSRQRARAGQLGSRGRSTDRCSTSSRPRSLTGFPKTCAVSCCRSRSFRR